MTSTVTPSRVAQFIGDVTPEQIGLCEKRFDAQGVAFYEVHSESTQDVYSVTYDKTYGFRCTCASGQYGFANVKHPSGTCKHVRWAFACSDEERKALAEMATPKRVSISEEIEAGLKARGLMRGHEHTSALYHGKYETDF